jgi:hypothetical protein
MAAALEKRANER